MSKKQIALVIVVVGVLVIVAAALIVDSKYAVLWGSPRIAYDKLVKPQTRAQIVVNVPMGKDFIKKQFLKGVRIPDAAVRLALPYEVAVVLTPDNILQNLDVSLFINDRRLAPIILGKINSLKIPVPFDKLFPLPMIAKERGLLVRDGSLRMDALVSSQVKKLWTKPTPTEALRVEGNHLVEAVIDNRDGAAITMAGAIAAAQGTDLSQYTTEGIVGTVLNAIGSVRLQGDVTPDNTLKLHLAIETPPECDDQTVALIQMALEMGMAQAAPKAKAMGITLDGKTSISGKVVNGDYTIPNIDAVLARL